MPISPLVNETITNEFYTCPLLALSGTRCRMSVFGARDGVIAAGCSDFYPAVFRSWPSPANYFLSLSASPLKLIRIHKIKFRLQRASSKVELLNHTFVTQFPFYRECQGGISTGNLIRQEHQMRMLTSPPSPTATISHCPQCGAIMHIKLIESDLRAPLKARHVFECEECCLPRTYSIERPLQ